MSNIQSVMLDCSFCIRLMRSEDPFHENCVKYLKYFIDNGIEMYLSSIVVSEYAVGDNPDNLLELQCFKLLEYDYHDAKWAGDFLAHLKSKGKFGDFGERKVVINDIKLFSQIKNRGIDAYITKDVKSFNKMIKPLQSEFDFNFGVINLSTPISEYKGELPF